MFYKKSKSNKNIGKNKMQTTDSTEKIIDKHIKTFRKVQEILMRQKGEIKIQEGKIQQCQAIIKIQEDKIKQYQTIIKIQEEEISQYKTIIKTHNNEDELTTPRDRENQKYTDIYEYAQWKLKQSLSITDNINRAKALQECLDFCKSQKQCEHMIITIEDHLIDTKLKPVF
jgi:hypothetical protein